MEIKPVISVAMLVYNHEKYLDCALQSIFSQELNVPFELVIGEDCSTDHSREIIDKWKEKYPNVIHVIYRQHNVGMHQNANDVIFNCRGDFVAWLEGDDYWIDNRKLEKQYSFLKNYNEYIGVTHNVQVVDKEGEPFSQHQNLYPLQRERDFDLRSFAKGGIPGQTGSFFYHNIFKNMNVREKEAFCDCCANGDSSIIGTLLLYGNIKVLPDIMSSYRFVAEGGSNWNSITNGKNFSWEYYQKTKQLETMLSKISGTEIVLPVRRYQSFASALLKVLRFGKEEDRVIFKKIVRNEQNLIGASLFCCKLGIKHLGRKRDV